MIKLSTKSHCQENIAKQIWFNTCSVWTTLQLSDDNKNKKKQNKTKSDDLFLQKMWI